MSLIDTSNTIDNSIYLKAKLDKNMVGSNFYIENLQNKRNLDWEYRYNRVDIEEELEKQCEYSSKSPTYTPVEAVITNVKSDTGEDMGTDWAHIAFKDLQHPCNEGSRYRFDLSFPDMLNMTEEQKHYNTSIWICVNRSPIRAGNSCTVRRCNTSLGFVGSPTKSCKNSTEIHYEPCILENDMKYMQIYENQTVPVPQAEWYATMQLNYFTNSIALNDRYIFDVVDTKNRENNQVYKVKAIIKSGSEHTFTGQDNIIEDTPIIIIALDKDMIQPDDDLDTRIAESATVYYIPDVPDNPEQETDKYYLVPDESNEDTILLGDSEIYTFNVYKNEDKMSILIDFSFSLEGIEQALYNKYFSYERVSDNQIKVNNLKTYKAGKLSIIATCTPSKDTQLTSTCEVTLGSFY